MMIAIPGSRRWQTAMSALIRVARARFVWQLLALVVLSLAVRHWLGAQKDPGSTVRAFGAMAPLFTVAVQCVTVTTPVGSSLIPTLNGMLFPLLLAMALNMAGGLAGSIGMYYVWVYGERDLQIHDRLCALPGWARRFARSDLPSLIIMRMLPWAGGNISTFLAGAYRVPLRVHIVSVVVGSLPGSIIYALFGAGIVTF